MDLSIMRRRGPPRLPLIRPGWISPRLSFARAQTGGVMATTLGADDATWSEVAADVPRYYGSARRLRIEGQRTNLEQYPRTIGSTNYINTNLSYASAVGPDGGASTGSRLTENTVNGQHFTNASNGTYTSGLSYVMSALVKAGTATTCQLLMSAARFGNEAYANFDLSAGTVGTKGTAVTASGITKYSSGWCWIWVAAPATSSGGPNASVTIALTQTSSDVRLPTYTGTSRYLDVAWGGLEQASFASTPILPATTGASTRGADLVSASLASLGIPASGACTVLGTFMIPQFAASSGATQSLIQIDDGGASNRFMLRNPTPTSAITVNRVAAGAVAGDASAGSPTAGVAFAAGLTIDGSGRLAASINGGAVGVRTGGPTSGMTTLRVGTDSSGASGLFGDIGYLDIIRAPVSDAQLQALVAAMPLT